MKTSFLLITACCLLAIPGKSSASPLPDFPFIASEGNAKRDVPPTNAKVTFTVLASAKTAEEATNTVQTALTKLVATLKENGVPEKQISAHDLDKFAVRKRTEDYKDLDILGYNVSRKVELSLPQLGDYSKIIRTLMAAENVIGVESVFDTSKRAEVESELTGEACAEARKKAELLAKGTGVSIASVYAVSSSGFSYLDSKFGIAGRSVPNGSALPSLYEAAGAEVAIFVPSTISLRGTVDILYRLDTGAKN